jgi:hypothetical protein
MSKIPRSASQRAATFGIVATFLVMTGATVVMTQLINQPGHVLGQTNTKSRHAAAADYDLTISNFSQSTPNTNSGYKRVQIALTLKNLSRNTLQISPGLQMFVRLSSGRQASITANYLAPGQIIGGPLDPDLTSELSFDYEIPSGETPIQFIYQPDAQSPSAVIEL